MRLGRGLARSDMRREDQPRALARPRWRPASASLRWRSPLKERQSSWPDVIGADDVAAAYHAARSDRQAPVRADAVLPRFPSYAPSCIRPYEFRKGSENAENAILAVAGTIPEPIRQPQHARWPEPPSGTRPIADPRRSTAASSGARRSKTPAGVPWNRISAPTRRSSGA